MWWVFNGVKGKGVNQAMRSCAQKSPVIAFTRRWLYRRGNRFVTAAAHTGSPQFYGQLNQKILVNELSPLQVGFGDGEFYLKKEVYMLV